MTTTENTVASKATNKSNKPTTVLEVLNEARAKTPEGGAIELNSLEKTLKLSRADTVTQVRALVNNKDIAFKVGRKSHSSQLLFNSAAREFLANRNTNQKSNPRPRKVTQSQKIETATPGNEINYNFTVTIGGQKEVIPVRFELEKVA